MTIGPLYGLLSSGRPPQAVPRNAASRAPFLDAHRLSAHLSLGEMTRSAAAEGLGIDNRVYDRAVLDALSRVAETVFEPVRAFAGRPLRPSSGYRCPALNQAVGGAPGSAHTRGEAIDLEVPGVANRVLALWIAAHVDHDQVILECPQSGSPTSGWVHVAYRAAEANRRQALTYTAAGGYTPGIA